MSSDERHHIPPLLLERACEMRHEPAPAEEKLWWCLRNRRLAGYKFRRQPPLAPFVADFFCAETKLVVELDGDSHGDDGREAYDASRTRRLNRNGLHVIRFENDDVFRFLDAVLIEIPNECQRLTPSPLEGEGGGEG
jgi:very-short-patch-repair endonuclease